jgi:hypothetical protein
MGGLYDVVQAVGSRARGMLTVAGAADIEFLRVTDGLIDVHVDDVGNHEVYQECSLDERL